MQSTLSRLQAEDKITDANNALAEEAEMERQAKMQKQAAEDAARQKLVDATNQLAQQREKEKQQLAAKLQQELDAASRQLENATNQMGWGRGGGGSGPVDGPNGGQLTEREQLTSDAWNRSLINRGLILGAIDDFFSNGGANQIAERLNIQGADNQWIAYELAKQQALNQGMSLKDAERIGRDAARGYRDAASSGEANALRRDSAEYERLKEKEARGEKLSDRERRRKEDLERQLGARKEEIERAKKQAQNIKDLPNNVAKIKDTIDQIRKQLDKLGLK